jgi:hypothetical protein
MRFLILILFAFSMTAAHADDTGWEEIPEDEPGCQQNCFPDDDDQRQGDVNITIRNKVTIENNFYIGTYGRDPIYPQQPFFDHCYAVGGPWGWTIYLRTVQGDYALANGRYRSQFFPMKRHLYLTGQCPNM